MGLEVGGYGVGGERLSGLEVGGYGVGGERLWGWRWEVVG